MSSPTPRRQIVMAAALLFFGLVCGTVGYLAWANDHWAQARLAEIEPRHARLLGLQASQPALEGALERVRVVRTLLAYPAAQDAAQAGNAAQQRVRDILTAAGLQVVSSQVLPAKEENGFDRIALTLRTEGDALALHSALAVLSSQTPTIAVNEMDVQAVFSQPNAAPRLAVQFTLMVMRERS